MTERRPCWAYLFLSWNEYCSTCKQTLSPTESILIQCMSACDSHPNWIRFDSTQTRRNYDLNNAFNSPPNELQYKRRQHHSFVYSFIDTYTSIYCVIAISNWAPSECIYLYITSGAYSTYAILLHYTHRGHYESVMSDKYDFLICQCACNGHTQAECWQGSAQLCERVWKLQVNGLAISTTDFFFSLSSAGGKMA